MQNKYGLFHSVMTADIVNSQKLSSINYETLMAKLNSYLVAQSTQLNTQFQIYRGDSFQVVFKDKFSIFKHAIEQRLFFLQQGLDVRVSLATGAIKVPYTNLATATGKSLVSAGKGLDNIKGERLIYNDAASDSFLLNIRFVDLLLSKLSIKQAQVLLLYLQQNKPEHLKLAEQLGTSRANVTKLLNLAHYTLVESFIALSESTLSDKVKLHD